MSVEKNYINVIEVDHNTWTCNCIKVIKPEVSQVTKIMYDENYGLIVACYRGYIAHYDSIRFEKVYDWHNDLKAIGSEKTKLTKAPIDNKHLDKDFTFEWIGDEQKKRALIAGQPESESP